MFLLSIRYVPRIIPLWCRLSIFVIPTALIRSWWWRLRHSGHCHYWYRWRARHFLLMRLLTRLLSASLTRCFGFSCRAGSRHTSRWPEHSHHTHTTAELSHAITNFSAPLDFRILICVVRFFLLIFVGRLRISMVFC